ncbi:ABC transporter permease [Lysinibacillus xylanilyticus]|uniref:ABC transporter permease n=1 Tax=Lysinibacillus xylanilyticus TaxID=582475 RepID=UPI0036D77C84
MTIFLKYLWRNICEKKFRSFIMLVALSLTTFLLFINLGIRDYFEASYTSHIQRAYGDIDISIMPSEDQESPFLNVDSLNVVHNDIKSTLDVFYSINSLESSNTILKVNTFGLIPKEAEALGLLQIDSRLSDESFSERQVIISEEMAKKEGYSIGDTILLNVNGMDEQFTIFAVAKKVGFFAQESELTKSVVIPLKTANDLYGVSNAVNVRYVEVSDHKAVEKVVNELKEQNPSLSIASVYDNQTLEDQTNTILLALFFVLLIVIVISFYIISSLFNVIIKERITVIGIFKSIGASKWHIRIMLLAESFFFGIIGGIAGIGTGLAVSPILFEVLNSYDETISIYSNPNQWIYIGLTLVFTIGVSILSSFIPVLKLSNVSIKQILMNNFKMNTGYSKLGYLWGIGFMGTALIISYFNTNYNLIMGLISILMVFVGGILFVPYLVRWSVFLGTKILRSLVSYNLQFGFKNLENNRLLRNNITLITVVLTLIITIYTVIMGVQNYMTGISNANDFDISITSLEKDQNLYDFLKSETGVIEPYKEYLGFEQIQTGKGQTGHITYIGLDPNKVFKEFHKDGVKYNEADSKKLFTGNYMIVDKFILNLYNLQIGDKVKIVVKGKAIQDYEIIGVMDAANFSTNRSVAMISLENFQKDISTQPFQILLKTDGNVQEVSKSISQKLMNTSSQVRTLEENIEQSMQGVDNLFMVLKILIILAVLLAGFGIGNNLLISFLQRQRELAILHSVCMSKMQLVRMFIVETIGVCLFASCLAFFLSFIIAKMLPDFLWGVGIAFSFDYPYQFASYLIISLFLLFLCTIFIPIFKLYKMRVVDYLRFD